MMEDNDDSFPSRRSVVKAVSGAIGAATLPASAAAKMDALDLRQKRLEAIQELPGEYDDPEAKAAFKKYGGPLLKELANEGLLSSPTLDAFEPVRTARSEPLDDEAKTAQSGKLAVEGDVHEGSGTKTAVISARNASGDADVAVFVLPEIEFAYADVQKGGDRLYLDTNDPEVDTEATTQGCSGDLCRKQCSGAPNAPFVVYSQSGGPCANTCVDYSPPCSMCDNQPKCDGGGGGNW